MELNEILNALYAGKRITLVFNSKTDRESFRVRLYKAKSPQDKALEAVCEEEKKVLRFDCYDLDVTSTYKAKIWLENKPKSDDFEVLLIE